MAFGKKGRSFKTLTQRQNESGPAGQGQQRSALRLQASNEPGGLSKAEKAFVKGTAGQDAGRVREVIKRVRKANRPK